MSNPKESENRNGKGGTICRGVKDARIKMPDKNFLCRQLGFDRHMYEDELDEQDLFQTNWQNAGICWFSNKSFVKFAESRASCCGLNSYNIAISM